VGVKFDMNGLFKVVDGEVERALREAESGTKRLRESEYLTYCTRCLATSVRFWPLGVCRKCGGLVKRVDEEYFKRLRGLLEGFSRTAKGFLADALPALSEAWIIKNYAVAVKPEDPKAGVDILFDKHSHLRVFYDDLEMKTRVLVYLDSLEPKGLEAVLRIVGVAREHGLRGKAWVDSRGCRLPAGKMEEAGFKKGLASDWVLEW
jgi:hypothetical protein